MRHAHGQWPAHLPPLVFLTTREPWAEDSGRVVVLAWREVGPQAGGSSSGARCPPFHSPPGRALALSMPSALGRLTPCCVESRANETPAERQATCNSGHWVPRVGDFCSDTSLACHPQPQIGSFRGVRPTASSLASGLPGCSPWVRGHGEWGWWRGALLLLLHSVDGAISLFPSPPETDKAMLHVVLSSTASPGRVGRPEGDRGA